MSLVAMFIRPIIVALVLFFVSYGVLSCCESMERVTTAQAEAY